MPHPCARRGSTRNRHPPSLRSRSSTTARCWSSTRPPRADALAALTAPAEQLFATLPLVELPVLSTNPAIRAALWHIRKGLYATIAGARPSGTTALLEDIAVPVARLSDTCAGLQRLFEIHGYGDAVIFGHAKDGNIHFLLTEDFDDPASVARYRAFTEDMVDLVLAAGGTLKAEHGTGKIMAPFVARQYGPELYAIMRDIKRAFDPAGILNPDTRAHRRRRPAPAQPQVDPDRRSRGRPLRRVRLLRTGLPEQGPHHHAAPADRRASRDRRGACARRRAR